MTCDSEWTLRFPSVEGRGGQPFEVMPISLTYESNRNEFDYARMKFPSEVGEAMKPHTRYEDGKLSSMQVVELVLNDETQALLGFKPDLVSYGDDYTHLELHDVQELLDSGLIDKQWEKVTLKDAYNYVYDQIENTEFINEMRFTLPKWMEDYTLYGESGLGAADATLFDGFYVKELSGLGSEINKFIHPGQVASIEADESKELLTSTFAVDLEQVSPTRAIWTLNQKFRVTSWVDKAGTLWVGRPEVLNNYHIAAPGDDRVWSWSSPSISHGREPIQTVVAEGRWVDESGMGTPDDIISWFNPADGDGLGDVRAEGIATRKDIDYGKTIKVKSTNAKKDAVDSVAASVLREEMKRQNQGTIDIDPELSGNFTKVQNAKVGDFLHVVPSDDPFENPTATIGQVGEMPDLPESCNGMVNNELYLINGVTHKVENGKWGVTFNLVMYPDDPLETFIRYFDPQSGEYLTGDEVFDVEAIEDN